MVDKMRGVKPSVISDFINTPLFSKVLKDNDSWVIEFDLITQSQ